MHSSTRRRCSDFFVYSVTRKGILMCLVGYIYWHVKGQRHQSSARRASDRDRSEKRSTSITITSPQQQRAQRLRPVVRFVAALIYRASLTATVSLAAPAAADADAAASCYLYGRTHLFAAAVALSISAPRCLTVRIIKSPPRVLRMDNFICAFAFFVTQLSRIACGAGRGLAAFLSI